MSESDVSWEENVFREAPLIFDDENTPMQEDDEEKQGDGEQNGDVGSSHADEEVTAQQVGSGAKRVKRKKMNVDNRKKKTKKRNTNVTIGYKEALIKGNPQSELVRVEVGYDVDMGVSVYVKGKPLHKGDTVTHYAVKGTMTVEEYASIYDDKKNYTPTLFELREKDYMNLYSKEE